MESHRDRLINPITDLPKEIWLNISSHLTPKERVAAVPTCQLFNALEQTANKCLVM